MFVEFIVPIVITISDRRTPGICHHKTEAGAESGSDMAEKIPTSLLQILDLTAPAFNWGIFIEYPPYILMILGYY